MSDTILVVDDEADLAELVCFNLQKAGFHPVRAHTGSQALEEARTKNPAMIILDIMLPDFDGLEVFRRLKREPKTASIPVLMLTAKAEEIDRVVGLELGAEDYVTKPFSPRELILRVRGILRRNSTPAPDASQMPVEFGPIRLDPGRFEVRVDGTEVSLTSTEFHLLKVLMEQRGQVMTRQALLEKVWGYNVTDRTVDTHIKRLREKLGPAGNAYIETVRGVGYRFVDDERGLDPDSREG